MPKGLAYPDRLSLAQLPTPLQPLSLPGIGEHRLWCKRDDLTGCLLSGNKIRKLEFVIAEAQAQGADTLITCGGLQSNHCRATALLAAQLGFGCELVLRGDEPQVADGNLLLSQLAGAAISYHPVRRFQHHLPQLLQEAADRQRAAGRTPYVIPTGASDGVGVWGYIAAAEELAGQFAERGITEPLVVCATGSGGTLAGLAAGLNLFCPGAQVLGVAVCDDADYFYRRVREDLNACRKRYSQVNIPEPENYRVVEDYIGPGYAQGYPEVFETIATVACGSGVVLDPVYTAKAFYGMLKELRLGHVTARDLVFVHTGGIFGVYPERAALASAAQ
ncbi:1-aminocyclopropane-1-carboxylate deaminase/D-cysteine desulfhydrase [Gilvimarinus agarilyticus]|uniref:1-aminocyclopropane-1-carboxylate deaminase/D-cysteine desulfhydrase n=1 Tax=Gilvimarinus agarilyticus TaxID=679259 RepID=UPI0005A09A1F|nr:D-cysteine desulfhydrase family protein [Gilvimarinus agarilyticus]